MTSSTTNSRAARRRAWVLVFLLAAAAGAPSRAADPASPEAVAPARAGETLLPIAVLPLDNLSGHPADTNELREMLREALESAGLSLLDDASLAEFLAKHRIRWTGGLSQDQSDALVRETGARAALVTSLDVLDDTQPPRIALSARLIAGGASPRVAWVDRVSLAGDDAPGFLSLGLVDDIAVLVERAVDALASSLARDLAAPAREGLKAPGGRFRPRRWYRSPHLDLTGAAPARIAVLPFLDESGRRRAGEIVSLLVVRHLGAAPGIEVLEPGVVRDTLLQSRIIMEGGLSVPQTEVLHSLLQADYVVTGTVTEFREFAGVTGSPLVEFTVRVIDARTSQAVWSSISYNQGDDRVVFFGCGRVRSASALASEMARQVVATFVRAR